MGSRDFLVTGVTPWLFASIACRASLLTVAVSHACVVLFTQVQANAKPQQQKVTPGRLLLEASRDLLQQPKVAQTNKGTPQQKPNTKVRKMGIRDV